MVWPLMLRKPGLWDRGMASDVRVQIMIEKKTPVWQTVVWPLTLQKPEGRNSKSSQGSNANYEKKYV